MPSPSTSRTRCSALLLFCGTTLLTGCASWQLPRIDPSGERVFIWPNQTPAVAAPPAVVAPPGAPLIAPSPAAPLTAPPPPTLPFGNVQAPPVYSDPPAPTFAPAPVPSVVNPFTPAPAGSPVITTPPPPVVTTPAPPTAVAPPVALPVAPAVLPLTPVVPAGTPNVATPLGAVAPACTDHLRVTPAGLMVPVGSEVVLKAGICGADGYLMANQRVDWMIDRRGVGQFSDVGGREPVFSLARWRGPNLIDPWNASGSTSYSPVQLTRGTPDPSDDVGIVRGDAWVSVTSLAEGTSYVSAYTPGMNQMNRATATIYWVDAQWQLPPSACVEPGRSHVLTTTVMRKTNGAPLAGWIVRYDVSSGASLGYEGGNSVEVTTDANGRASVEVSPAASGGGTTNVGVTIVRPAMAGPNPTPRFEFGRGNVPVTWTPGAPVVPGLPPEQAPIAPAANPYTPYTPSTPTAPSNPPPPTTSDPRPSLPSGPQADPYTPPPDVAPAGPPKLELQLRRTGPEQVGVGEYAGFEVIITNRGSGTARSIRVRDRFDSGLRHPSAKPNELAVEYPGVRDLPPDESTSIPLTFQVVAGGTHCHEVTVTAEGAEPATARACVTARQAALEVTVTAPRSRVAGEIAQFNVVIRNTGEVAATNVEIVNRYDAGLEPSEAPEGHTRLADGGVLLKIDRLEAGERRSFSTTAVCRTPSNRACNVVRVTGDGGLVAAAEGCVEILPTLSTGPGGSQPAPTP